MKNDRLVILAAGSSSRMSRSLGNAIGERMTKCMIPVDDTGTPFLEYLLGNAEKAGFREVVLVTAPGDFSIEKYFGDSFRALRLSRVVQTLPAGRVKPAGTADALLQVLEARPEWSGGSFSVCNSDNLYSPGTLEKLRTSSSASAVPCYDKNGLIYPEDRISRFAVISVSEDFTVTGIVEKPTDSQVEKCTSGETVFVSMNLFKLDYMMALTALKKVPYGTKRNEKELPSAIDLMILENPGCIQGISVYEHVPDLTSAGDIQIVSDEVRG